jgi:hypothetical protein
VASLATRQKVDADSLFEIGSVSKSLPQKELGDFSWLWFNRDCELRWIP